MEALLTKIKIENVTATHWFMNGKLFFTILCRTGRPCAPSTQRYETQLNHLKIVAYFSLLLKI